MSLFGIRCKRCSKPLLDYEIEYCENCSNRKFYFSKNISLFPYGDYLIKNLVKLFKFDGVKESGILLSEIIRNEFFSNVKNFEFDLITYVPSSKDSLKERGFNPVEFILKKLKVNTFNLLGREKHFKKQSELLLNERERFIRGQYYLLLNKGVDIRNKKILLIDDIFTSGNTLNEISRILLENGALNINTLTFFRD
ncbi:MAG: phosphoribosyltransferase family protein [Brevinematales bacterium]|nr:phosphoribosyltransferase family protein [Brevinematales bacterium]